MNADGFQAVVFKSTAAEGFFLLMALALSVPGTPVCQAPPLAGSVLIPTSDANAERQFFHFRVF